MPNRLVATKPAAPQPISSEESVMYSAPMLRSWIGRVCVSWLAGLALIPGLGCSRLNLWEGPSYRDDPVVSDTGTSGSAAPALANSPDPAHPAAQTEPRDAVKTSRANR